MHKGDLNVGDRGVQHTPVQPGSAQGQGSLQPQAGTPSQHVEAFPEVAAPKRGWFSSLRAFGSRGNLSSHKKAAVKAIKNVEFCQNKADAAQRKVDSIKAKLSERSAGETPKPRRWGRSPASRLASTNKASGVATQKLEDATVALRQAQDQQRVAHLNMSISQLLAIPKEGEGIRVRTPAENDMLEGLQLAKGAYVDLQELHSKNLSINKAPEKSKKKLEEARDKFKQEHVTPHIEKLRLSVTKLASRDIPYTQKLHLFLIIDAIKVELDPSQVNKDELARNARKLNVQVQGDVLESEIKALSQKNSKKAVTERAHKEGQMEELKRNGYQEVSRQITVV